MTSDPSQATFYFRMRARTLLIWCELCVLTGLHPSECAKLPSWRGGDTFFDGTLPSPRGFHGFTSCDDGHSKEGKIYVFGGNAAQGETIRGQRQRYLAITMITTGTERLRASIPVNRARTGKCCAWRQQRAPLPTRRPAYPREAGVVVAGDCARGPRWRLRAGARAKALVCLSLPAWFSPLLLLLRPSFPCPIAGSSNDLHAYEPTSMTWFDLSSYVLGALPPVRQGHGFASAGGKLYVHAGALYVSDDGSTSDPPSSLSLTHYTYIIIFILLSISLCLMYALTLRARKRDKAREKDICK
jgi:hypothetical protein